MNLEQIVLLFGYTSKRRFIVNIIVDIAIILLFLALNINYLIHTAIPETSLWDLYTKGFVCYKPNSAIIPNISIPK